MSQESKTNSTTNFQDLDLGTGSPTSVPMEVVEVTISEGDLLDNFAKAFVAEAERKAPLKFDRVGLTVNEVTSYCTYLLSQRVMSVNDHCRDWRKLKNLWIPSFVQYVMSQIGKVVVRQFGLTFMPVMDQSTMTFDDALAISEKIAYFEDDLQMVRDAMPRGVDGNIDVMSTALIAGYIRSTRVVEHVSSTYAAAFLNLKLKQESAFQALYRVQYDDIQYITSALTASRVV